MIWALLEWLRRSLSNSRHILRLIFGLRAVITLLKNVRDFVRLLERLSFRLLLISVLLLLLLVVGFTIFGIGELHWLELHIIRVLLHLYEPLKVKLVLLTLIYYHSVVARVVRDHHHLLIAPYG